MIKIKVIYIGKCKKENIISCDKNVNIDKNDILVDKYISNIGYDLLKKYLYKDYKCIHKFSIGCLSNKQFEILSK